MTITDSELDTMIDCLQHLRLLFEAEENAASKTSRKVQSSVAKVAAKVAAKNADISGDL